MRPCTRTQMCILRTCSHNDRKFLTTVWLEFIAMFIAWASFRLWSCKLWLHPREILNLWRPSVCIKNKKFKYTFLGRNISLRGEKPKKNDQHQKRISANEWMLVGFQRFDNTQRWTDGNMAKWRIRFLSKFHLRVKIQLTMPTKPFLLHFRRSLQPQGEREHKMFVKTSLTTSYYSFFSGFVSFFDEPSQTTNCILLVTSWEHLEGALGLSKEHSGDGRFLLSLQTTILTHR